MLLAVESPPDSAAMEVRGRRERLSLPTVVSHNEPRGRIWKSQSDLKAQVSQVLGLPPLDLEYYSNGYQRPV